MRTSVATLSAGLGPLLVASLVSLNQPPVTGAPRSVAPSAQQAAAYTSEDCLGCHADIEPGFATSPHAVLDTPALASRIDPGGSCMTCHGDGTEHIESGGGPGITSFAGHDEPLATSRRCLGCHATDHPRFPSSPHGQAGIGCTSCHTVHAAPEARLATDRRDLTLPRTLGGRLSETCVGCHPGVFTEFTFTEHHRLEEGTLSCVSCHDPHAPSQRVWLGGFSQRTCIGCHQDKGGPFVFEHGSSLVEGCVACHTPHGSTNRHMLTFQSVADQCYSCHAVVPGFHARFDSSTVCTNCHITIHGSNLDPAFLK